MMATATAPIPTVHDLQQQLDLTETRFQLTDNHALRLLVPRDPSALLDQLFTDGCELDLIDERLPYWAEVWPSSHALAHSLLTHPGISPSTRCLELGCGLGLAGIAAGFRTPHVLFSDYQPAAVAIAQHNWSLNHPTSPESLLLDWRSPNWTRPQLDLIIAADVAYEDRFFQPLANTFETLLHQNGFILLAEPGRPIAAKFYRLLQQRGWNQTEDSHQIPTTKGSAQVKICTLWRGHRPF